MIKIFAIPLIMQRFFYNFPFVDEKGLYWELFHSPKS